MCGVQGFVILDQTVAPIKGDTLTGWETAPGYPQHRRPTTPQDTPSLLCAACSPTVTCGGTFTTPQTRTLRNRPQTHRHETRGCRNQNKANSNTFCFLIVSSGLPVAGLDHIFEADHLCFDPELVWPPRTHDRSMMLPCRLADRPWTVVADRYIDDMRLTEASIRRYRSIADATVFKIETDVTCLVGKNESGKTAALQALYKSRPIAAADFDEELDYPSRLSQELGDTDETIPVTVLSYELDDDDVTVVEEELGSGSVASRTISVTVGYHQQTPSWSVEVDGHAVVRHLRGSFELPSSVDSAAKKAMTPADLAAVLEEMDGPTPETQKVVTTVARWREQDPTLRAIDILNPRRPKFVYFGDYDSMPGKISIPALIAKRSRDDLTRGEQALLALLKLAKVNLDEFSSPTSHEHLIRKLENASNAISNEVFKYWSQNKNLEVRLMVIAEAEPGATPPLDQGPLLQIRVYNSRHRVSVPFDERSRGFVWFFSFLAYFSELEGAAEQPLVLLLDEPGLSLHATAQHDLLRFIEERLAKRHQVIFSTHSPFMVYPRKFNRIRTVIDQESTGTVISGDVLRADSESAFPLQAALGIELTQTLFVGPDVLFVEGPSDVVYLQYLSAELERAGHEGLDQRWVLVPGGGITKLPAFLTLFGANDMKIAVLVDSSANTSNSVAELKKTGRLYGSGIMEIGEALGRDEADMEDLLDPSMYLNLVSIAYAGALSGAKITSADLAGTGRIAKDVEDLFKKRGINDGRFNHFAPAGALLRSSTTTPSPDAVLERSKKLIHAINLLLAET